MTTALLLPETTSSGKTVFWAVVGERRFSGHTPGEAIDAMLKSLPPSEQTSLLLRQFGADEFFLEPKRARLQLLMDKWRQNRDTGTAWRASRVPHYLAQQWLAQGAEGPLLSLTLRSRISEGEDVTK
jgi:hypothetical protein